MLLQLIISQWNSQDSARLEKPFVYSLHAYYLQLRLPYWAIFHILRQTQTHESLGQIETQFYSA
jgi:hypothetical protein